MPLLCKIFGHNCIIDIQPLTYAKCKRCGKVFNWKFNKIN